MYDKEFKQRKIKLRPRIKLNCKIYRKLPLGAPDIHVFILRNSVEKAAYQNGEFRYSFPSDAVVMPSNQS